MKTPLKWAITGAFSPNKPVKNITENMKTPLRFLWPDKPVKSITEKMQGFQISPTKLKTNNMPNFRGKGGGGPFKLRSGNKPSPVKWAWLAGLLGGAGGGAAAGGVFGAGAASTAGAGISSAAIQGGIAAAGSIATAKEEPTGPIIRGEQKDIVEDE